MEKIVHLVPEKLRPWVVLASLLAPYLPYVTRAVYSLMNGRGIVGVFSAILFGTNTPKPADTSYPPTNPANPAPKA